MNNELKMPHISQSNEKKKKIFTVRIIDLQQFFAYKSLEIRLISFPFFSPVCDLLSFAVTWHFWNFQNS